MLHLVGPAIRLAAERGLEALVRREEAEAQHDEAVVEAEPRARGRARRRAGAVSTPCGHDVAPGTALGERWLVDDDRVGQAASDRCTPSSPARATAAGARTRCRAVNAASTVARVDDVVHRHDGPRPAPERGRAPGRGRAPTAGPP